MSEGKTESIRRSGVKIFGAVLLIATCWITYSVFYSDSESDQPVRGKTNDDPASGIPDAAQTALEEVLAKVDKQPVQHKQVSESHTPTRKTFSFPGGTTSLSGKVLTDAGEPAINITVRCDADNGLSIDCVTGEDGLFSCDGDQAEYWFCRGYDLETGLNLSNEYPFSTLDEGVGEETLFLYPKADVHVLVSPPGVASSLKILLKTDSDSTRELTPQEDAIFVASSLPLGKYFIHIPGYDGLATEVLLQQAGVTEVHIQLPNTGTITGTVVNGNQYPLSDREVRVVRNVDGSYDLNDVSIPAVHTDPNGHFSLQELARGDYILRVEGESKNADLHTVSTGGHLDIVIGNSSTVQLQVLGETGTRVTPYQLAFKKRGSEDVKFLDVASADGAIKLEDLSAGTWLIGVVDSPEGTGEVDLALQGAQTRQVEIIVSKNNSFSIANFYNQDID